MALTLPERFELAPTEETPWYRNGILPLVVAIPVLTVFAGLSTVWIANHGADALIADAVRPDIVAMHADPAPDARARALGVSAALGLAPGRLSIDLTGAGDPAELQVVFANGQRETDDQTVVATRSAPGHYTGAMPQLGPGTWYVEAAPADRAWRVIGELDPAGHGARLAARREP